MRGRTRRTRGVCSLIPGFMGTLQGVHSQDSDAAWRAVTERILFVEQGGGFVPPPVPVAGFRQRIQPYLDLIRSSYRAKHFQTKKLSYDEFIDLMLPRRQTRYRVAKQLLEQGYEIKAPVVKAFLKREKVSFEAKDPAPRLIQPMPDEYLLEVGCYLKPFEKPLMEAIETSLDIFISKGKLPEVTAMWIANEWEQYSEPVCIDLDVSRFDQHVHLEALKAEFSVYNGIFKCDYLRKLLNMQMNCRRTIVVDGECRINFRTEGGRLSGVPNTGMGNVLLMCVMLRAYFSINFPERRFGILDNGDDCNVIMERGWLAEVVESAPQWFLEMGFTLKIENVAYALEDIEHCQASPIEIRPREWTMVRKLRRVGMREALIVRAVREEKDWDFYRSAISCGGMYDFAGIPVHQTWFWKLGEGTKRSYAPTSINRSIDWLDQRCLRGLDMTGESTQCKEISPFARTWFTHKFGIRLWEQLEMERSIQAMPLKWCDVGMKDCYEPISREDFLALPAHTRYWSYCILD